MKEFLHGWRRKAGVVTLVMACLVFGLWVRSRSRNEIAYFALVKRQHAIFAVDSRIVWITIPDQNHIWVVASQGDYKNDLLRLIDRDWQEVSEFKYFAFRRWSIPLWWPLLPLTLLSAYLMLWKPRRATTNRE